MEVTSFLLNEKRTEITKIELKQRVTVLLVPNKNLETPNYRLERLRHDDPRLENLQASYTMIDAVDGSASRAAQKAKGQAGAGDQGILPDAPAPRSGKPRQWPRLRAAGGRHAGGPRLPAGRWRLLRLDQAPVRRRRNAGAGRPARDTGTGHRRCREGQTQAEDGGRVAVWPAGATSRRGGRVSNGEAVSAAKAGERGERPGKGAGREAAKDPRRAVAAATGRAPATAPAKRSEGEASAEAPRGDPTWWPQ